MAVVVVAVAAVVKVSGGDETSVSPEAHAPNGCDEQGGNCLGAREEDTAAEEERQRPKYRWMKGWRVAHRERRRDRGHRALWCFKIVWVV